MTSSSPILSVVIPTLGRPILIRTLDSLISCKKFSELEIIVAGDIRDPVVLTAVQERVKKFSNLRHLPVSFAAGDSSEKKNAGARAARSDLVAFLDDDVVVAEDWPSRIAAPFEDPEVGAVSGPSLVPPDVGLFARLAGLALSSPAAGYVAWRYRADHPDPVPIKWSKIIGCNMAYRKRVLDDVGGFDPAFWPGEEMIASFRTEQSGRRLVFQPSAYVYHYPRQSFVRFWKQIHGYGATRIRLFRGGVEIEPTTMVPAVWVASIVVLAGLAAVWRLARLLLVLDLGLYGVLVAVIAVVMSASSRQIRDLLVAFVIPVMHVSYGIGSWVEFFRPNKDLSEPAVAKP